MKVVREKEWLVQIHLDGSGLRRFTIVSVHGVEQLAPPLRIVSELGRARNNPLAR